MGLWVAVVVVDSSDGERLVAGAKLAGGGGWLADVAGYDHSIFTLTNVFEIHPN